MPAGRKLLLATAVAGVICAFAATLQWRVGGPDVVRVVDDLGVIAFSLAATIAAFHTASRLRGNRRLSWIALGCASAGWTVWQSIWAYSELVENHQAPFPSFADAAFLVFPVGAVVALWAYIAPSRRASAPTRQLIDGLTVAISLFVLSWVTTLRDVYHGGASSQVGFAVALAYPLTDLALVAFALLLSPLVSRAHRLPMLLMSTGLIALAVGDTGFAYLATRGKYHSGSPLDAAWPIAFTLLTAASLAERGGTGAADPQPERSWRRLLLPYALLALAGSAAVLQVTNGRPVDRVEQVALGLLAIMVFVRQFVTLQENERLLREVAAREEQLEYQAFHDALTGLANRAHFTDRLQHALDRRERTGQMLAVLLLDLDDFKVVNDTLGHAAGDELLIHVAQRLRASTRKPDTVARLGGDEFAVILEDGEAPQVAAERLLAVFQNPFVLHGHLTPMHASIGLTVVEPGLGSTTVSNVMRDVDIAMYAAKNKGKARLAVFSTEMREARAEDDRRWASGGWPGPLTLPPPARPAERTEPATLKQAGVNRLPDGVPTQGTPPRMPVSGRPAD